MLLINLENLEIVAWIMQDDLVKKINNFIANDLDISTKINSQIERISNYFSHEIINAKYESLFDKEDQV